MKFNFTFVLLILAIYNVHVKSEPTTFEVEFEIIFSSFAHSTKITFRNEGIQKLHADEKIF